MTHPDDLSVQPTVVNLLTLESLAGIVEMSPDLIRLFVEQGLIEPIAGGPDSTIWFEASCVTRLRTIRRLRRDLGINLPGVAVILELLDRVRSLQRELEAQRLAMNQRPPL